MAERLQKLMSQWGVASRRQAEALIQAGRVQVNGTVAHLGQKADPQRDRVSLDDRVISPENRPDPHYLLLNKPTGVVCTCDDPRGRRTVLDLLPAGLRSGLGIHPVGRLDAHSTGALILTNDGDLTYRLTHPRHHVAKTYRVWVEGCPTPSTLQHWRQGVMLAGRRTLPAQVRAMVQRAGNTELEIVLHEGRNRQIRRVAEALGHPVVALHRTAIGSVDLGSLKAGNVRDLTKCEVSDLNQGAVLSAPR
jgi:23S rRNA pseudouridine2605 synthase